MATVVGLFETTRDADRAVDDLKAMHIPREAIGVMAQKKTLDASGKPKNEVETSAGVGATSGTAVGGIAGLLVGIGALAIPGIGPVIAAGTLGAVLGSTALGAGIGAATGGIVGALTGMGLSKDEANFYAEGVKQGGILVTVKADTGREQQVTEVFRNDNAADINTRRRDLTNNTRMSDDDNMRGDTATRPGTRVADDGSMQGDTTTGPGY